MELPKLLGGRNERYVPGPGYHDRIFTSAEAISQERGLEGTLQHYGVYLPNAYEQGEESPIQWWFHFRGGTAHIAAAAVPRIFEDMGEDRDAMVVTPRGRGTSTWYVGKGHVDYQEVWDDVHRTFSVDRRREYISGHSMGGWATYLMTIALSRPLRRGPPGVRPGHPGRLDGRGLPGLRRVRGARRRDTLLHGRERRPPARPVHAAAAREPALDAAGDLPRHRRRARPTRRA